MPSLDVISARIEDFVRDMVESADARGVALGLSGGVDSAVTAYLCCRALGKGRCLALLLPNLAFTPSSETEDGLLVAKSLGIPYKIIQIGETSDSITGADVGATDTARRAVGNLNARLRASVIYYEAQKLNYLVAGTDDRSEHLLGYFTKYGDGACDMMPIAGLYKTQVWDLAKFLGVPERIVRKEPGPHLWPGHTAAGELGLDYTGIDRILERLEEDPRTISESTGIPYDAVRRILRLHRLTVHKRHPPPVAPLETSTSPVSPAAVRSTRPWGYFERFTLNQKSTVKLIHIDPNSSLSLQYHTRRSEYWRVISGDCSAVVGEKVIQMGPNDELVVPVGVVHRLTGGPNGARILEIAVGDFSESDIVRIEDGWGRE